MLFRKTVDNVLSSLNKAIADLGVVSEEQARISIEKEIAADELYAEAEAAGQESLRATRIADRLAGLLE